MLIESLCMAVRWPEIGDLRAVRVRTIDVGLAEGLFTTTLGPRELTAVVAAVEARRP